MITSSIVLYKTAKDELNTVVSSVLDSCISFLYLIDNSPNRELESFVAKFDKKRVFMSLTTGIWDTVQGITSPFAKL